MSKLKFKSKLGRWKNPITEEIEYYIEMESSGNRYGVSISREECINEMINQGKEERGLKND